MRLGPWEIILIILLIVLLIWGPRRLPELGKALGEFIANLKKGKETPEQKARDQENDS